MMTSESAAETPASSATDEASPAARASKVRHPLGLPAGSVRGLLTLLIVGFVVVQTAQGRAIGVLWVETLMIVLAHYFTSRRFLKLSPETIAQLEASGELEPEANPLYLPRHTIRATIVAAFIGLAVYLGREGRLFEEQSVKILGTVGAYFLGILARIVIGWWNRRSSRPIPDRWGDIKALVTLAVVAFTIALRLAGWNRFLLIDTAGLENLMLGLVLFYFGSR